jgi:hypothetical protein
LYQYYGILKTESKKKSYAMLCVAMAAWFELGQLAGLLLGMGFVPYSGFSKIKCALRFILEANEERGDFVLAKLARVSCVESPTILEERETKSPRKSPLALNSLIDLTRLVSRRP